MLSGRSQQGSRIQLSSLLCHAESPFQKQRWGGLGTSGLKTHTELESQTAAHAKPEDSSVLHPEGQLPPAHMGAPRQHDLELVHPEAWLRVGPWEVVLWSSALRSGSCTGIVDGLGNPCLPWLYHYVTLTQSFPLSLHVTTCQMPTSDHWWL